VATLWFREKAQSSAKRLRLSGSALLKLHLLLAFDLLKVYMPDSALSEDRALRSLGLEQVGKARRSLEFARNSGKEGRFATQVAMALIEIDRALLTAPGDGIPDAVRATVRDELQPGVDMMSVGPEHGELARHMSNLRRAVFDLTQLIGD
jgi:hypothetical protein